MVARNQNASVPEAGHPRPDAPDDGADFEKLLSDLSTAFIRVAADQIDAEIERWLLHMVLALGVDLGTVAQLEPAEGAFYLTHQAAQKGVSTPGRGVNGTQHYPWLAERVLADEVVVLSRVEDLPPEASKDLADFRRWGTKSDVTIPLKVGGAVVGAMAFGTVFSERMWSQKEVQRLKLVAEIFGNALERKRSEAEIHRLSEELRQVSKVATIGELTAALAHELKQPLAAILSNAETAYDLNASQNPNRVEIADALADIIRDEARADEIIGNVRTLFQRDNTKKSSVDLRELVFDVDRIAVMSVRTKGVRLSVEVPKFLPSVSGDRTQLMQATLNLLFNAFDSVCAVDGPREVGLSVVQIEPRRVCVSIRDSGKGIDPALMPRLFDPFVTTKPTGMGMGLAIVRSIVENHGGRLWATQNPEGGATFQFTLPIEVNLDNN